ncbi:MAG TPA: protein translocase subunit SecD [Burkholderiaceae bacterium]|nr:protein translocase subunit SecD [Burkholderiaceae bacterium]
MNRYPLWKYITVIVVVALGFLYSLPNLFGEQPAVQVSSARPTVKVDAGALTRVEEILTAAKIQHRGMSFDGGNSPSVRARFADVETQKLAKETIEAALNPDKNAPNYIVALSLVPASPSWLTSIRALPMFLGLDLRGGVHFLLQVDMKAAVAKRMETVQTDIRTTLRDKNIRGGSTSRVGDTVEVRFTDAEQAERARNALVDAIPEFNFSTVADGSNIVLRATLKPESLRTIQDSAIAQNISTLNNRVNELGVAEPVIQQQGADRIVVQLPGVQDVARAKNIIGRTATLEFRLNAEPNDVLSDTFPDGGRPVNVKRQILVTGDNLSDAQPGFDSQTQQPSVNLVLDAKGGRIMRDTTRDNIGKQMAIILFEKGKGEIISNATIRGEFGNRFQISGAMNTQQANDLALLLRAGSLAAPMDIVEERTVGASLGKENIEAGFKSMMYGFIAISVFMVVYYALMGLFSVLALAANVMLLIALLSVIQATLTLPGIAAIALTLGMAIDANVLINERIREELRAGRSAAQALSEGFDKAWATILDSNITTLIAGVALFAFGSGPIRGFAVVHCLGIITSMFSAVMVARALTLFWYSRGKKVKTISIGQIWRPDDGAAKNNKTEAKA